MEKYLTHPRIALSPNNAARVADKLWIVPLVAMVLAIILALASVGFNPILAIVSNPGFMIASLLSFIIVGPISGIFVEGDAVLAAIGVGAYIFGGLAILAQLGIFVVGSVLLKRRQKIVWNILYWTSIALVILGLLRLAINTSLPIAGGMLVAGLIGSYLFANTRTHFEKKNAPTL